MTARIESLDPTTDSSEDRKGRLESLAQEINQYRHEAAAHGRANLDKQRVIGRALHEAKRLLKKAKHPGGWRRWCETQGWNTRWADALIRLHTQWDDVKEAVHWSAERGNPTDGVTGALKAITEWKRRDDTPEDIQRRKRVKGARHDRRARDLVVARFLREIRSSGEIPETWPVEAGEFVAEALKDEEDGLAGRESEKRASHSDDALFVAAGAAPCAQTTNTDAACDIPPEGNGGGLAGTRVSESTAGDVQSEATEQDAAPRRSGRRRTTPARARRKEAKTPSSDDVSARPRMASANVIMLPAPGGSARKSYPVAWRLDPSSQRRIRR